MLTTLPRQSFVAAGSSPLPRPRIAEPAIRRSVSPDDLEQAVQRYGTRLLAVARRHLECEADCADALQEAYLKALRGLPRFRGESDLGTWLHRIVVNVCLMKRRSAAHRRTVSLAGEIELEAAAPADIPHWDDQSLSLVRQALHRLTSSQQTVIQLRYFEGFSTSETAALLGVSTAVAKTRLHRACRALRREVRPELACEA